MSIIKTLKITFVLFIVSAIVCVGFVFGDIVVDSLMTSDSLVDVGESVTLEAVLNYDDTGLPVTDGSVTINGLTASNRLKIDVGDEPYRIVIDTSTGKAYVINKNGRSISVIDISTDTVVKTISLWFRPYGISVDSTTGTVYIIRAEETSGNVYCIDTSTDVVSTRIDVGWSPRYMAVDPVARRGYVSVYYFSRIDVIDLDSRTVVDIINEHTLGLDIDVSAGKLYTVPDYEYLVRVLDLSTHAEIATIPVVATPRTLAVDTSTGKMYVASYNSDVISVIEGTTVIKTLDINGFDNSPLTYSPITGNVYVPCSYDDRVYIIDTSTDTITATLNGIDSPTAVAVDTTGKVYVVASGGDCVYVYDNKWSVTDSKSSAQSVTYDTITASDNSRGVTTVDMKGQSATTTWDQVKVQSITASDTNPYIDYSTNIDATLIYSYDNEPITDGTVTINGLVASHQGAGVWRITDTKSSAQTVTYSSVAASGNTRDIENVDMNGQSVEVTWQPPDIIVNSMTASVEYLELDGDVTVDASLTYEDTSNPVVDGTVTINGLSATHQGAGVWRITDTKSTVQSVTYDTVTASGNTRGITSIYNTQSATVTWDQIKIQSIIASEVSPCVEHSTNIDTTLVYESDEAEVTDGTVTINGLSASHQGSGVWRITDTKSSVQTVNYDTVTASGNTRNIDTVNQNGQSVEVTWRAPNIIVDVIAPSEDYADVNDLVAVTASLVYEDFGTPVVDGTVTINGVSATYVAGGSWRIWESRASVQSVTYDTVTASGNSRGITSIYNTQSFTVTWEQITVQSVTASETTLYVDESATIDALLWYESDNTPVIDGPVTINGETATHQGSGVWRITETKSSPETITYESVTASANTRNIATVDMNSKSTSVTWKLPDIIVESVTASVEYLGLDDSVTVDATIIYGDTSAPVVDGAVTINGISASPQGSGVWRITDTKSSIQTVTYDTVEASGNMRGVDTVDMNGKSDTVTWDQVKVQSIIASDNTQFIDYSINIDATLVYESDETQLTDGTVTIKGETATHQGSGVWRITETKSTVQTVTYDTVTASGNTRSTTTVNMNSESTTVNWVLPDIIVDSLTASNDYIDLDSSVTVDASLIYEDTGAPVIDGMVTINGLFALHQGSGVWRIADIKPSAQLVTYDAVTAAGNTRGINTVDMNGQSATTIWDQIQVQSITASENTLFLDYPADIDVSLIYVYDSTPVTDGTVTINGLSIVHQGSGVWRITDTKATEQTITYDTVTASGNTRNLNTVDINGQSTTVSWIPPDIIVDSITASSTQIYVDEVVTINVSLIYEDTSNPVVDGDVTINGLTASHLGAGIWNVFDTKSSPETVIYEVVTASGNTRSITSVNMNEKSVSVKWRSHFIGIYIPPSNILDVDQITYNPHYMNLGEISTIQIHVSNEDGSDADCTVHIDSLSSSTNSQGWATFTFSSNQAKQKTIRVTNITASTMTGYTISIDPVTITWTSIEITLEILDSHINVGETPVIDWTGVYTETDKDFKGSLQLNPLSTSLGEHTATVANITDPEHNITYFTSNTVIYVNDRITVTGSGASTEKAVLNEPVIIWFTAQCQSDATQFDDNNGMLLCGDHDLEWSDVNQRWQTFVTSSTPKNESYVVTGVIDTLYGLTVFSEGIPIKIEWIEEETVSNQGNSSVIVYPDLGEITVIAGNNQTEVIVELENHKVLSITSNSTISRINMTDNSYSFIVSGEEGTTGMTEITIPKNVTASIDQLKVFIDGVETSYEYTEYDDHWVILVKYSHSSHTIDIMILETPETGIPYPVLTVILGIITATSYFILRKSPSKRWDRLPSIH